ncbi:MAG TPA: tyrosinase family protein [Parafilimonas sp.]|nr:tyrosinase family protein [Parafilimonas sp.]
MALGDGIRRNIALVSDAERTRFINAILQLDTTKFFADGVSYWDKQEDIHKNGHQSGLDVHGGIEFLPWHRSLVNHFEDLLREVDPELSLHYWDWTTDPRVAPAGGAALFTNSFMDNANAEVSHLLNNFESSEGGAHLKIWRDVGAQFANGDGTPAISADATLINATSFNTLADGSHLGNSSAHGIIHTYIGGTILQAHYSFHDPFVFLIHSNLDRLWAKWQTDPLHPERLTAAGAYSGVSPDDATRLANDYVNPWAGETGLEPWTSDPTKKELIKYTDLSIIIPRCYNTNQSSYRAAESENPLNGVTNRYQINFNSVPEEETTWRAAVIRVYSCEDVSFRVKAGTAPAAPFSIVFPPDGEAEAHHDPHSIHAYTDVRIWFAFTAGATGSAPQNIGPVNTVIECVEDTSINFNFELVADTIERPTVAVQLVLDQSGSMNDPAGTSGLNRLALLKDAATLFANIIQKDNGIGIIRFDQDAYAPDDATYGGMFITKINNPGFGDATRNTARNMITLHGAHGDTSVGDGIEMGRIQLNAVAAGDYTGKAMIVFTDGLQNQPKSIEDVSSSINNQTFAIGLGNETQVNTLALNNITQASGGYLLLSGLISSTIDDYYRVSKFFMQILANVTNTQIVKDPNGYLNIGTKVKIPFVLCEADINARVVLLNQYPIINLSVETPDGQLITTANAAAFNASFDSNNKDTVVFSFPLPVLQGSTSNHAGTWYAVLEISEAEYKKYLQNSDNKRGGFRTKGSGYSVSVHSFSNLKMKAGLSQTGMEPGAKMTLRAALTEYDVPVQQRATVTAETEYPDHSKHNVTFYEKTPGIYEADLVASMAGIYNFHIIATGTDYKAVPFTREQILTGSVFLGGNNPGTVLDPFGSGSDGNEQKDKCCKTMSRALWIISILLFLILIAIIIGIKAGS